jgi:hypothetical protein
MMSFSVSADTNLHELTHLEVLRLRNGENELTNGGEKGTIGKREPTPAFPWPAGIHPFFSGIFQ